jgi:hypothetical protein
MTRGLYLICSTFKNNGGDGDDNNNNDKMAIMTAIMLYL